MSNISISNIIETLSNKVFYELYRTDGSVLFNIYSIIGINDQSKKLAILIKEKLHYIKFNLVDTVNDIPGGTVIIVSDKIESGYNEFMLIKNIIVHGSIAKIISVCVINDKVKRELPLSPTCSYKNIYKYNKLYTRLNTIINNI